MEPGEQLTSKLLAMLNEEFYLRELFRSGGCHGSLFIDSCNEDFLIDEIFYLFSKTNRTELIINKANAKTSKKISLVNRKCQRWNARPHMKIVMNPTRQSNLVFGTSD